MRKLIHLVKASTHLGVVVCLLVSGACTSAPAPQPERRVLTADSKQTTNTATPQEENISQEKAVSLLKAKSSRGPIAPSVEPEPPKRIRFTHDISQTRPQLEAKLAKAKATPAQRIILHIKAAQLWMNTKPINSKTADAHHRKAIALWKTHGKNIKDAKSRSEAAFWTLQAQYYLAKRVQQKSESIHLNAPMPKLKRDLLRKAQSIEKAERAYVELVHMANAYNLDSPWTVAAKYEVGRMYEHFLHMLQTSPRPNDPNSTACTYTDDDYTFPIQERAIRAYRDAHDMRNAAKGADLWRLKAYNRLCAMSPQDCPKQ